jgi:ubiquinone/menaquinone biosynthesis C-methylase UbiE
MLHTIAWRLASNAAMLVARSVLMFGLLRLTPTIPLSPRPARGARSADGTEARGLTLARGALKQVLFSPFRWYSAKNERGERTMIDDPAKLKAATTYNAAADHFDDEPLGFWARTGLRTIERLQLPPGAKVLDVGCGTGASAIPAAKMAGPRGRVIAVDLADRLLEVARRKAGRHGHTNIEFRTGDMECLGYPDDHFDAVVSVFSIFFVSDMARQVRELWRMVRPGGQLAITTWGPRVLEPASSFWWNAVRTERPDLVPAASPWDRITHPDAVRDLLREAGIANATVVAEDGFQPLRSPDDWWLIVLGSGFRWTVEQLGPEVAERVRAANIAAIRDGNVSAVETNTIFAVARKP